MAKRLTHTTAKLRKCRKSPRSSLRKVDGSDIVSPRRATSAKISKNRKSSSPTTTMEIISQLSENFKKHDTTVRRSGRKKSSKKENLNGSISRNSSYRLLVNDSSFTSTPAQNHSAKSADYYDFDGKDEGIQLHLELSPIKKATPGSNRKRQPKRKSTPLQDIQITTLNSSLKSSTKKSSSSSKKRKLETTDVSVVKKSTPKNQHPGVKNTKKRSVVKRSTPKFQPVSVKSKQATPDVTPRLLKQDSGVFTTPETTVSKNSTPSSTTTTQSENKKTHHKTDSERQLRKRKKPHVGSHLPNSPMLSPVQKLISPDVAIQGNLVTSQSELFDDLDFSLSEPSENIASTEKFSQAQEVAPNLEAAPEAEEKKQLKSNEEEEDVAYRTLDISKTYTDFGYGHRLSAKKKTKKRTKKNKPRESISRYDMIADKMNQEFDDLDDFELSLD